MLHPRGQDLGEGEGEEVRAGSGCQVRGQQEGHKDPGMVPSLSSVFLVLSSLGRWEDKCR